ncbi:MAG: ATP-binding protein [Desulfobulbus sp.]|jgi:two-component system sensor histidine kinase PilS (NtrC family)|nr:ATP-binding protein [Desulfobulbus sp.]
MLQRLARMFPPVADSEQQTRRHLLHWLFTRVLLFTLLIAIASFFRGKGQQVLLPPQAVTLGFLVLFYAYTTGSALLLQKTALPVRAFSLVQLLSDTVCTALLVYATGCSNSMFTPILLLPVIAAGLILHRSGGLLLAAVATLLYGAVLGCELLHWLPAYFRAPAYRAPDNFLVSSNLFATYGLIFFLAALFSGQLARRLRATEKRLTQTMLEFDRLSLLYKQIFDDIATGIITTDSRNLITSCNRSAERITGTCRMLILGQPFTSSFPAISLQEERQGRSVCDFRKRDGTAIRLGYSYSNLNMPAEQGQEETAGWKVITLQDISQIERMEQHIREAEKLAAVGQMSASVAHGFRNPLAAISGSAQILAFDQDNLAAIDPATFKTLVGIVLRESGRMAKTITDFLQFARPARLQPEWFTLGRLVDEVIAGLLPGPLGAAAGRIGRQMEANLGCWADRQQLQTVLAHLLENACAAVGAEGGGVTLAAAETRHSGQETLEIEVRDQGPGIAPELRTRVFEPFFSNRADGTGLGLAIVRQIIDNHHGTVAITDNSPAGCVIRLNLPLPRPIP